MDSLAVEVAGEVEGEASSSNRGLDQVHVDVVEHGAVEGRYAEAHEGELDDGVSWRVEAPLEVIEHRRHLGFVATQYSAAVRTGMMALAVVRPAWNPGLHSSRTLSLYEAVRITLKLVAL